MIQPTGATLRLPSSLERGSTTNKAPVTVSARITDTGDVMIREGSTAKEVVLTNYANHKRLGPYAGLFMNPSTTGTVHVDNFAHSGCIPSSMWTPPIKKPPSKVTATKTKTKSPTAMPVRRQEQVPVQMPVQQESSHCPRARLFANWLAMLFGRPRDCR